MKQELHFKAEKQGDHNSQPNSPMDLTTPHQDSRPFASHHFNKRNLGYYLIAFIGVIAIATSALLNHALSNRYATLIQTSEYSSESLRRLIELGKHIAAVNAPGNDIFESNAALTERENLHKAKLAYYETLNNTRNSLIGPHASQRQAVQLLGSLDLVNDKLRDTIAEAEYLFQLFEDGQKEDASAKMAVMNRHSTETINALNQVIHQMDDIQSSNLNQQEDLAGTLAGVTTGISVTSLLLIAAIIVYSRKVTAALAEDHSENEGALHELSFQQAALDEHAIVAMTNTKGTITYVNDKFCKISKYDREELIGQDHKLLNSGHHPTSFFVEMYKTIAKGDVWNGEVKNKAKDGSYYWVNTTVVPYRNSNGRVERYIAIRADITKHKQAEEEAAKAFVDAKKERERAEHANQAKGEFLATMSHEIRTPMNGVIGFANLLLDAKIDKTALSYTRSILSSGEALLGIINDILDFSKIEAGKLEIEPIPFDLQKTAGEALEMLAAKATEKDLELLLRYDSFMQHGFIGDPGRMRQVIVNLVGNALKFTAKGHVLIEISPNATNPDNFVRVAVSDTGIGIPIDAQKKLFTKFTQADSSTARRFGGTGLGLAISKQLVELMGGEIGVDSIENQGSTFWFTLPFPKKPVTLETPKKPADISGRRVLIVDDYPLNCILLEEQCSIWKLECTTACSGEEALQKIDLANQEKRPYDIALIDYSMPDMDGEELARRIKSTIPLLLLTSDATQVNDKRFLEIGFKASLLKPIVKIRQLRTAMARAMDIKAEVEENIDDKKYGDQCPKGNYRILVVDDAPVNQMFLKTILTLRYGYKVDVAGNGEEASVLAQMLPYDIIFMDCMMPIMDGYEATKTLRRQEMLTQANRTPIIATTANAMDGELEKCKAAGMDDYISKPINPTTLVVILNRWLTPQDIEKNEPIPKIKNTPEAMPTEKPETTNSAEYFNISHIRNNFPDHPEIVSEMLTAFTGNLQTLLGDFEKSSKIDELRLVSHSMKGCASECGANVLTNMADTIEKACINKDLDAAHKEATKLKETVEITIAEIQKAIASA